MNIYREVVNRIEIPALPSLENGYYLLRFERNGTTSNVYCIVENESGMGVPITATLTEIGTGTPDPEAGEVLLAPGPWTLFFYEQVSGTNTNPDCSTIPLGQTEVTVYGEDAAVLSQTPTDCPSGPGGTVNAEDVTVTPYIYINAGSGPGAYRNNGNTADGRIIWELAGGAGPDQDAIVPGGGEWELAVGGTVMYTSDNYPTDIQDVTGWTIANGLAPTPSISPDYGDDVQEQLEGLAGAVGTVDAYVNGTRHNAIITVSGICDSNGHFTVNLSVASGGRPALASAAFIGGFCADSTSFLSGKLKDATLATYEVAFWDITTGSEASDATPCAFTVLGIKA